jgi:two-component system, OmpR family, sensor kinase
MPAIAFLRRNALEVAWVLFSAANFAVMLAYPRWETIPFHLIWVSFTLLYGLRVFAPRHTAVLLGLVFLATGGSIFHDTLTTTQPWDELSEVPLMSAMFLAMVWHARRRQAALVVAEEEADRSSALVAQQERLLHDVSHELRTPVTIARGQLEVLRRAGTKSVEAEIALDELGRLERILDRLLLLAKAEGDGFAVTDEIDVEAFLEDVFMRWSEVAPRTWRLGAVQPGTLLADREGMRIVVDALLENAVKYTRPGDAIELRATAKRIAGGEVELAIEVADEGCGIPAGALGTIFERFGRADAARTRSAGGVGLGLAIVAAITRAHGGSYTAASSSGGSTFTISVPRFRLAQPARDALVAAPVLESA